MADDVTTTAPAALVVESAPAAVVAASSAVETSAAPSSAPEVKTEAAVHTALGGEPSPTDIKDLLGEKPAEVKTEVAPAEKPVEAKPAEVKTEADKPAEVKAEEKPVEAVLPTFEDIKIPEGFEKNEKFTEFTKELAEFEVENKADHAKVQAFGQKLFDKYVAELKENNERVTKYYNDAFEKQKKDWAEAWQKDPELGVNRIETTRKSAIKAVESYAGTAEQKVAFRQFVDHTGVGDNPALIRLITNMQAKIDSLTNENNKMLPAKAPAFQARSKVTTRYGQ
jgi:hypothetical protein